MKRILFFDRTNAERGMTLVEVIAVIILIGLIMTVVAKGILGKSDAAKAELNVVKMQEVKQALETYRLKYNVYPDQMLDMVRPSDKVTKGGSLFTPLLEEDQINDIWGFPLLYKAENNGRSYTITSLGADGAQGGTGSKQDITIRP